ncbi:MAG: hypothetical protein WD768_11880 [Phycisphaeraceae bacterium]
MPSRTRASVLLCVAFLVGLVGLVVANGQAKLKKQNAPAPEKRGDYGKQDNELLVTLYTDSQGNNCDPAPSENLNWVSENYFLDGAGGDFAPARLEKIDTQWKLYLRRTSGQSCAGVHIFYMEANDPDMENGGPAGIYTSGLKIALVTVIPEDKKGSAPKGPAADRRVLSTVTVKVEDKGNANTATTRSLTRVLTHDTRGATGNGYRYLYTNKEKENVVIQPIYDWDGRIKAWECIVIYAVPRDASRQAYVDRHLVATRKGAAGQKTDVTVQGDYQALGGRVTVRVDP